MRLVTRRLAGLAALSLLSAVPLLAAAQAFPTRAVKLVVPLAPSGGADVLARIVTARLAEKWGQPVLVENKPGADAMIGSEQVAKSRPDGYTLLFVTPSHVLNPVMRLSVPYDTVKDFAAVTIVAATPFALVASNSLPVKTTRELIAAAKAQPGKISIGNAESSSRLAGEMLESIAGVDLLTVSYKALPAELGDLVGGHLHLGFASLTSVLPYYKAGTVKLLGVSGPTRSPLVPEIPTLAEEGVTGHNAMAWYGFVAPAGTPPEVVNKIQADVAEILARPDVKDSILKLGAVTVGNKPAEFTRFIETEITKSGQLLRAAGVKPE